MDDTGSDKAVSKKKGQKNLRYPTKKQSFYKEKDCFLSGTSNFFGPSYFETALVTKYLPNSSLGS